ncbi:GRIP and coiled-coil domain-containing protein 2 [Vanessa cardui]|uniref:GRIP and coiled-coil domain-containing protein 2 n=1 Tax=Vanessa cardui TaxID=171605 RepID=UPI001F13DFF7|nr:GRIP and coiled-coil domain-containing protein 2 [Vanessa cardui]
MDSEVKNQSSSAKKSPFDDLNRDELIAKCKGLLVIAQKAKHAKAELQNEIVQYKTQLENSEKERKTKEDNLQTLQELVDSLTEQKLTFITDIDAAQSKLRGLTAKCNQYEEELNKQKDDLTFKENNLAIASQKLSDLDSEVISLKRQNKRLLDENEQLITQLTELEARTEVFNQIGLQQRDQLQILEDKVQQDDTYQTKIEELNHKIQQLEKKLKEPVNVSNEKEIQDLQTKIGELTNLYEAEKTKKEKANIKLRSYKDKILKCANCINQLKNSRFILTKTVKEYSENIPKWQNEIIKASKVLENQMTELNNENVILKDKLQHKERELEDVSASNSILMDQTNQLKVEINTLQMKLLDIEQQLSKSNNSNVELKVIIDDLKSKDVGENLNQQIDENNLLKEELNNLHLQISSVTNESKQLELNIEKLKKENSKLNELLEINKNFEEAQQKTALQLKALESEKDILVKEKQNAKDAVIDLGHQKKMLKDQITKMKNEIQDLKRLTESQTAEIKKINDTYKLEKDPIVNQLKNETIASKEKYDNLKKEYDNLLDLNGLLQEEVETLKLSLEQPKDDAENLSDLNVSLQADIVKLETKLSAYKQENASLLLEVKETRSKVKEFDNLVAEYEDAKSKLVGYKTENAELLNEMKEINQVLKERGEAISKLQKAVSEMERLIETLEKDKDIIKEERDSLLKKNEKLEGDLKNVKENTSKNNEATETLLSERDNALKSVEEKDAIILALKEDLEKLKQQASSSVELPNEDMSTSTISRAEDHSRMRELDDSFEDKYTKLRMFALKLKKKLNETTSQLQSSEQEKTKLKKFIADNNLDSEQCQKDQDVIDGPKMKEVSESQKSSNIDLEAKVKNLTADLEASGKIIAKLKELEAELLTKSQLLSSEIEAHKVTKGQLEKAIKDVKKKNVLSLEMEDYERSMKELTTKMEDNKKKIIQMESTIDMQEGTITAMKTQIKLLEEQIKSEETQSRLLKEELQQAIEDSKEKDNVVNQKKDIITKLMQDLEDEKRKNEEADLEMTALLSEKEKIIMNFGDEKAEMNNKMKKLELRCAELNEKLTITNIELADLKTEYTSYKVRAQAVLRQNQTVDKSQEEQLKEDAAALKTQVESLTQRLSLMEEQLSEVTTEAESGRKRLAEASAETARAQQRTARLQADLSRLSHQLDSERSQHKVQISTLTQCYKSQISDLEAKLQRETDTLKKQLTHLQDMMKAGKADEETNRAKYMIPVIPKEEGSDSELDINVSLIPREEGEGSEAAPSPPLSKSFLSSGNRRSPVPLERLLEEGVPDNDTLDTSSLSLTSEQEITELRRKVQAQQQRVKHVTELLSESERECARLGQLSELLKGELRRVRASAGNAHNTEYVKNVTLKFLTLPPGDERSRLVPVLQKILTLSSDETHKVQAIAKGHDPNPSKGWGSYLPWPGGK